MIGHDDLRNRLRAHDPAQDRELTPLERATMRAMILGAAPRRSRSLVPLVAFGGVMAVALVAAIALLARPVTHEATRAPLPSPQPEAPAIAQVEAPRPVPVARPPRVPRAQARPALRDVTPRTTRIEFTAPEGTRILWFVGSPDAKELGS
jgi:hypothetical protein